MLPVLERFSDSERADMGPIDRPRKITLQQGQDVPARWIHRGIAAATIGTALESLDLAIYAFLATVIAKLFFPTANYATSLLLAFATYGGTFIFRPLGAIAFGIYADRHGRKAALATVLALTGVASLLIALMPTFRTVGIWAPIGLVACRLLVGFSAGGEQGSAVTYIAEQSVTRRAERMSWLAVAGGLSQIMAAGLGALMASLLTPVQIEHWGWRIPFLVGAAIYPVGVYVRRIVPETAIFAATKRSDRPLRVTLRDHRGSILAAMSLCATASIIIYVGIYLPSYAIVQLHIPAAGAMLSTVTFGCTVTVAAPLFGRLIDRIGRARVAFPALLAILAIPPALFIWMRASPELYTLLATQVAFGLMFAAFTPIQSIVTADLFPPQVRATGVSFAIALAVSLFGGFAPFIFLLLGTVFHHPAAPSLYLVASSVVTFIALWWLRRTGKLG